MSMPRAPEMKFENPDDQEQFFEEEEEREFEAALELELKTDPYLEVHEFDIKAFRLFRREFKLNRFDPESLDIYVVHPERNVAITRAFRRGSKIPNFHFLTETHGEADMLKRKSGFEDVKRGIAERHKQRADITVVLDAHVSVSSKMLRGVERGGWFLCRMNMANSVRAAGKYKLMGVIDREHGIPRMNRNTKGYWEKAEVESDQDFERAQGESAVTYQEALEKVKKAGYSTKTVLESYKRLIEKAKEQNPSLVEDDEALLPCTIEHKGETIDLGELNTVLPLKERDQNSENIVIFKKNEMYA